MMAMVRAVGAPSPHFPPIPVLLHRDNSHHCLLPSNNKDKGDSKKEKESERATKMAVGGSDEQQHKQQQTSSSSSSSSSIVTKKTQILVTVEDALDDLIVVSFTFGTKSFRGVLLNSAPKRTGPYGVAAGKPGPGESEHLEAQMPDADKLYSVSQRFTYLQGNAEDQTVNAVTEPVQGQANNRRQLCRGYRERSVRTMRLRPRQVLCHKCRSICNENSENVEANVAASKGPSPPPPPPPPLPPAPTPPPPTEVLQVPPVRGLAEPVNRRSVRKVVLKKRCRQAQNHEEADQKKRKEEPLPPPPPPQDAKLGPIIKISFGPQGKGTVLEIASRTDGGEMVSPPAPAAPTTPPQSTDGVGGCEEDKVVRKALKKARKEAGKREHRPKHHKHKFKHKRKQKEDLAPGPPGDGGRMAIGAQLWESWNCDAVHGIGADHPPEPPPPLPPSSTPPIRNNNDENPPHEFDDIKQECLHQKLSISLKRLTAKSYARCGMSCNEDSYPGSDSASSSSSSVGEPGEVPEFPDEDASSKMKPLMMRICSHNVDSCTLIDGRTVDVGDIVWGKIHGFPWWPGRVLSITVSQRDNGVLISQQAHVAWFGSSTSSHMPCSQLSPFLEYFKSRYNKKKRGPYKEAIKQATLAAQQVLCGEARDVPLPVDT